MIHFVVFLLGLIVGSFLNVCIYRIPKGDSIVYPPSHCTSCKKRIKWYDMFPVISYLMLKGRCRNCGEKISIRYPVIELMTGIIFTAVFLKYAPTINFLRFSVMASFMIVIGIIDYDTTDVYLKTTLPGITAGVCFAAVGYFSGENLMGYIYAAMISYGLIAVIVLFTGGMGWGDAEICLLCSLFLGFKLSVVMLFVAFVSGGIFGTILVLSKRKSLKNMIAFGPFIAFAAIFASIFGDSLLKWYIGRFFI